MKINRTGKKSSSTERRHWITFQQETSVSDGEGGFTMSWTDFLSVFAAVYPYRASQRFEFKSVDVDATHLIKTTGYLQLPEATKWEGTEWEITWSGIDGATVRIYYSIDSGSLVEISASETNNGSYTWNIPEAAIGRNVVVRVVHATDDTEYVNTDPYLVVASEITNRDVNEKDRISFDSRVFEILTIENVQERDFECWISCKERR